MAKKKHLKALVMGAVAMTLSCSMLVGTTFAWFTDSVTSSNNVIKSGNLDVELEYRNSKTTSWTTVDENTNVFQNDLWEPGHTEVVYLKVSNAGSLDFKYKLGVNVASETPSTNVYGDPFELSDYIYFDVVNSATEFTYANRAEAMADTTETTTVAMGYSNASSLEAQTSEYATLIVYMPATTGNVVNHAKNAPVPTINLGINVVATQIEAEEDSFGDDYDGGAPWLGGAAIDWYAEDPTATEYTLTSAEDLAGLAELVNGTAEAPATTFSLRSATLQDDFKGKTLKLSNDIDLKDIPWTPIGNWDNAFEGTFDGNGYTISNLYINLPEEETGSGVGLFGVAKNATIKGINVENVNIVGYEMVATIVGSPYTGCKISDCHVTGNINIVAEWAYVAGVVGYGYTKIENCSVVANGTGVITSKTRNAVGGISAWLLEDVSSINNCEVKNLSLTGWANIGAITGFIHRLGVIDGCSAENVVLTKTREDGISTIGLASGGWSYDASKAITITNNTFKNIELNGNYVASSSADILYGGEYAANESSNFILDNNVQENITNNLVEVKNMTTVEELINALKNGGEYVLGADLTLDADNTIMAVAAADNPTVLHMNGKTITATSDETGSNRNVFDVRGNLTVKNGTIEYTHTGANMGWSNSTNVFNVTAGGVLNIENATVTNKGGSDMAFVAHLNNWGKVTLNVKDSTLTSSYIAVRVFNSGNDMNNVTVKNSTLAGKYAFWVHNYTVADFGTVEKANAHKALLNFDLYDGTNTFTSTSKPETPILYGFTDSIYFTADGVRAVLTADELQSVLNNATDELQALNNATDGMSVAFGADIQGDVTAPQAPDVKVTVDGRGHTFAGVLTVDGKSGTYTTAGLTVKNVTFRADSISADACIRLGDGTNDTRYTCNVTVDNCTFDVNGAVGVKSYTGGDKNLTIKGCTATANAHSLAQLKGIDGVLVEGCTVNSVRGINFNNSLNVTVKVSTIDVQKYALRFGESENTTVENFSVIDCTLKSANVDGDAAIVLRAGATNANLTITNTTIVANIEMSGHENANVVIQ